MSKKILVVDDEKLIVKGIRFSLEQEGMEVDCAYDGEEALEYAKNCEYDLVLLDVMLPKIDGFQVCQQIREFSDMPIVMLTAKSEDMDKILGLEYGADDYMTKPFVYEELFARVRALTRRVGEVVYEALSFGDLTLDLEKAELRCGEKAVHLGYKEFAIMKRFLQHPQLSISKEELIVSVWGSDSDAGENNVEVYISFLRKKLHFLGSRVQIVTMRRIGYRIEDTAS